ncbi:MAG: DUF885 family protein [Pseudomonadota bacterium]
MQLLQMFHQLIAQLRLARTRKQAQNLLYAGLFAATLSSLNACSQVNDESRSTRRAISQSQAVASDFLRTELAMSPETASRLDLERYLGPSANFALNNHSQAGFERRRLVRIELLQRLQRRPRLPEDHPLTRDLLIAERALVDLISLEQLGYGRFDYASLRPYAVDPYSGIWIEGPALLAYRQSITNAEQATAYVARIRALSAAVQDAKRRLVADQASGILLPRPLLEETQIRLGRLLDDQDQGLSRLLGTFAALTANVSDLDPERVEQLNNLVRFEFNEKLVPAYQDLRTTLDQVADNAADQAGVWAQPRGQDLFSGILTASTGETVSTERLHDNHLELASQRRDEVLQLMTLESESLTLSTPRPERLSRQYDWFQTVMPATSDVPDLPDPAQAAPTELDTLQDLATNGLWVWIGEASGFPARTEAVRRFQAILDTEPYSTWRADGDGARAPYRELLEYPAVQAAWQLYLWRHPSDETSSLDGPVDRVAHAGIDLIQTVLAAADTGIHLNRWSIAEATDYIAVNSGLDEPLSRQLALAIAARPGFQSAIAIAHQRFEDLSARAEAVLGEQYSETDFQRTLIAPGPRPLYLIEKDVESWYGARLETRP